MKENSRATIASRSNKRRKRRSYFLSADDKAKMVQMYWSGEHPADMAKVLKISEKTAYKYCATHFAPELGWARGFPSLTEGQAFMTMSSAGMNDSQIAAHFKRPMWVVARTLRPAGIITIEGAPVDANPETIMIDPPRKGILESMGGFFRRLLGGSH